MDLENLNPGAQLQSLPIHDMIFSFARSIAEAQWAMDKLSVEQLKEMANTPAKAGASDSLLSLGLEPTFYTFEDNVLEIFMEISMRVEEETAIGVGVRGEASGSGQKASVMVGASLNVEHARRYGADTSAATTVSTRLITKPAPVALINHFRSKT